MRCDLRSKPLAQTGNAAPCGLVRRLLLLAQPVHRPATALFFWLLILIVIGLPTAARAQTDERPPAYWQFDAIGQVDNIVSADIDKDGFIEFLVSANNQLDLLRGDGQLLWSFTMPSSGLHMASIDNSADAPRNIAVAGETGLTLLDHDGDPLWSNPRAIDAPAAAIAGLDYNNDNRQELLLLMQNGTVQLYEQDTRLLWEFPGVDDTTHNATPQLIVADFNRDGQDEAIVGYFDPQGFSKLDMISSDGKRIWERIIEGRINALTPVEFDPEAPLEIGVGTSRGRLHLFSITGEDRWPRTLNAPITSLASADWPGDERVLAAGTNQGRVVLFNAAGQRVWDKFVCSIEETRLVDSAEYETSRCADGPDSRIDAISAAPLDLNRRQPVNLVITYTDSNATSSDVANILLVNNNGNILAEFISNSPPGLSQLVDLNHDNVSELLLTSFGTVELLSPAATTRQNVENLEEWPFRLRARPTAAIAADIEGDGQNELFVGASDGRLLRLRANGVADWVTSLDGEITDLQLVTGAPNGDERTDIVVGFNGRSGRDGQLQGYLDLFGLDTQRRWAEPFELAGELTTLTVADSQLQNSLILAGSTTGEIVALDQAGTLVWQQLLDQPIAHIAVLRTSDSSGNGSAESTVSIIAAHSTGFIAYDRNGTQLINFSRYPSFDELPGTVAGGGEDVCKSAADLLQLLEQGTLNNVICLGRPLATWERLLGRSLELNSMQTDDNVYVPIGLQQWRQSEFIGGVLDRASAEFDNITTVYRGDLTGDGRDDVALGSLDGSIFLDLSDGSQSTVELTSPVLNLTGISGLSGPPGLLVTTENGLVSLYRFQLNHPPLVTSLGIENDERNNRYNLGMAIIDAEGDEVGVDLELYDPELDAWIWQEPAQSSGNTIFWAIDPPQQADAQYRINYREGAHLGTIEPGVSLAAVPVESSSALPTTWLWLLLPISLIVGYTAWRQTRSPQAQVRRFYRRLVQTPHRSLPLIEAEYNRSGGSPDFLLMLASTARNQGNQIIAGLVDGLYLLADRPNAAVSIIDTTLSTIAGRSMTDWEQFDLWHELYRTSGKMLSATSITNIVYLRPRLLRLLELFENDQRSENGFTELQPIMNSLRDSERVELAEDRLVYLNEAAVLLRRLNIRLGDRLPHMENRLARPIVQRWMGLVTAEIESVRGRARIWITLKTTNIAPVGDTVLALEVKNIGRAPAEELTVRLEEHNYCINGNEQGVPFLAPGRSKEVNFAVKPPQEEQFRVSFQVEYSDRNQRHQVFEYANVVNVLRPVRNYEPILNPYAPGTPLRKNSRLFFGRTDLFQFIAEEAGRLAQQSVLILVGQRRTGKTSALLRLDTYLPDNLLPVYIDCQSLGIVSGMAAFFTDIAWLIADTLEARGLALTVPEMETIAHNPAHWFQREFIPEVVALLPDNMTIVLAFDEFEALESLVNDGILPATFFTYLRHLMQHGTGLSFIFAGTHRLEEMTSDYWSVLFNIALYKEVLYLSRAAATQLIAEPVAPHIVYDDLALDKLWRMTAGHPYFLQLVCYTLVKRANQERTGYVTISDVNTAVDEMIQLGEVHFAYLWQQSTKHERLVLTATAHLMERDTPVRSAEIVQALVPYGIHLEPAQVSTALNRLVRRSIMQNVTDGPTLMYEARIGLVLNWVEQTKGLNQLYET